jgi:hypothetical protein
VLIGQQYKSTAKVRQNGELNIIWSLLRSDLDCISIDPLNSTLVISPTLSTVTSGGTTSFDHRLTYFDGTNTRV